MRYTAASKYDDPRRLHSLSPVRINLDKIQQQHKLQPLMTSAAKSLSRDPPTRFEFLGSWCQCHLETLLTWVKHALLPLTERKKKHRGTAPSFVRPSILQRRFPGASGTFRAQQSLLVVPITFEM